MDRLAENQYKLELTINQMKRIGFKYDCKLDDYVYKFPVYVHNKIPTIFCKLGIDEETNRVWFNVYDTNDTMYYPYYDREYGRNSIIPIIEENIFNELSKLGVTKVN